jgi:hypothetical protein
VLAAAEKPCVKQQTTTESCTNIEAGKHQPNPRMSI